MRRKRAAVECDASISAINELYEKAIVVVEEKKELQVLTRIPSNRPDICLKSLHDRTHPEQTESHCALLQGKRIALQSDLDTQRIRGDQLKKSLDQATLDLNASVVSFLWDGGANVVSMRRCAVPHSDFTRSCSVQRRSGE